MSVVLELSYVAGERSLEDQGENFYHVARTVPAAISWLCCKESSFPRNKIPPLSCVRACAGAGEHVERLDLLGDTAACAETVPQFRSCEGLGN